ncbi:PREDICTED: leucine-rich repeat-containing protein 15-like [Vollenhovia emeryi]|uniref:leucine-rich repeat-containing protein 15-like n=1 Tax=Vollenhovia emeryi TaxID=411798 RepID=UPI0005F41103|nr:PREDICTED: leucine-rich repeat-containing protein 15-like [Vollenhovia emeryi]
MALGYKFTIVFVFVIIYLAKAHYQNRTKDFDFKRHYTKLFPTSGHLDDNPSGTTRQSHIYPHPTIHPPVNPCIPHSHIFSFSNVGLQKIGRDFINSNDVINLSLDDNDINEISPFAFRNMRNLKYLDLSGNKIPKEKLLALIGNNKLETLIIDNNRDFNNPVTNMLTEYEPFPNLKYLHLCNNQLGNFQIPFHIATPSLTHLHLSNNSINSSNIVFDNLPATLTQLHLAKNFIDRIKQGKLRNIQELNMDDNVITQVCFENCEDESIPLKGAFELRKLALSNNLISEISLDAFSETSNLLELDLSGNKISDVAMGTFNNTRMISVLSLANNTLVRVPDVCSLYNLKTLDLSGNRISAIPYLTFCTSLRNLEFLYLSNNVITTIEARAFYSLQNLQHLDLSNNLLKHLPPHWGYSLAITELHLERNNFTELDSMSLVNIKTLRNIYLDENPLLVLKARSFHSLPESLNVHLTNIRIDYKCQCEEEEDNNENGIDDDEWN